MNGVRNLPASACPGAGPVGQARPGDRILLPLAERRAELGSILSRLSFRRRFASPGTSGTGRKWSGICGGRESTAPGRRSVDHAPCRTADRQNRLEEARTVLSSAQKREPRNLRYRLALADSPNDWASARSTGDPRPSRERTGTESRHRTGSPLTTGPSEGATKRRQPWRGWPRLASDCRPPTCLNSSIGSRIQRYGS